MICMRKHIDGLYFFDLIAVSDKKHQISCKSFGVAGHIHNGFRCELYNRFQELYGRFRCAEDPFITTSYFSFEAAASAKNSPGVRIVKLRIFGGIKLCVYACVLYSVGNKLTPTTFLAFGEAKMPIVPVPQYASITVSLPVSPANSSVVLYSTSVCMGFI